MLAMDPELRTRRISVNLRVDGSKLRASIMAVERAIVIALMLLMLAVVLFATIELALMLFQRLVDPSQGMFLLEIDELVELFGFFLLILIGIELLETIGMYLEGDTVHAEIVLLVALIAIARKLVVLDLKEHEPVMLIALAVVILSLAGGYVLIKRSYATPA